MRALPCDNDEDEEQIENDNTGVIQDMHKFAAALTSEEANFIHGCRDDEAVGNDDNLEEMMDDIDRETAPVMKEWVATSTRDGYERRNINFMIWFFDNLENTSIYLNQPLSAKWKPHAQRITRGGQKMAGPVNLGKVYVLRAGKF